MGSLLQTCKDIEIQQHPGLAGRCALVAQCQRLDGTWQQSSFELDKLLGNNFGKFVVGGQNFSHTSLNPRLETVASGRDSKGNDTPAKLLLKAALMSGAGSSIEEDEANLEILLANLDGNITTRFNYELNARQEAKCLDFLQKARNVRLEGSSQAWNWELVAELRMEDGSWVEKRVMLNDYLSNQNGYLARHQDGSNEYWAARCHSVQLSFWDQKKQRVDQNGQPLVQGPFLNPAGGMFNIGGNDEPSTDISPKRWVIKPEGWNGPDYGGPWDPPSQPYPASNPTTVCIECYAEARDGSWRHNKVIVTALVVAFDGGFKEATSPIWVGVPEKHVEDVAKELDKTLKENPGAWVEWADDPDKEGMTLHYVFIGDRRNGPTALWNTTTLEARASFQHFVQDKNVTRFQHVSFDALTIEAHGTISDSYAGVGASIDLIQAEASIFDLTLGLGVESGIGVQDETIEVELMGCGIMIGREVGVSVFGNKFAINLGRLFGI